MATTTSLTRSLDKALAASRDSQTSASRAAAAASYWRRYWRGKVSRYGYSDGGELSLRAAELDSQARASARLRRIADTLATIRADSGGVLPEPETLPPPLAARLTEARAKAPEPHARERAIYLAELSERLAEWLATEATEAQSEASPEAIGAVAGGFGGVAGGNRRRRRRIAGAAAGSSDRRNYYIAYGNLGDMAAPASRRQLADTCARTCAAATASYLTT